MRSEKQLIALLESLPRIRLGQAYTEQNRAQDFIAVFWGDSTREQGMRVLAQLMDFCNPTPGRQFDAHQLAFREGQRWTGAQILGAFVYTEKKPQHEKHEGVISDA